MVMLVLKKDISSTKRNIFTFPEMVNVIREVVIKLPQGVTYYVSLLLF